MVVRVPFIGALAGVAFADWYGRRANFVLPPSRVRKYVFWIVRIASTIVTVMMIVPMGILLSGMLLAAWLYGSPAGS